MILLVQKETEIESVLFRNVQFIVYSVPILYVRGVLVSEEKIVSSHSKAAQIAASSSVLPSPTAPKSLTLRMTSASLSAAATVEIAPTGSSINSIDRQRQTETHLFIKSFPHSQCSQYTVFVRICQREVTHRCTKGKTQTVKNRLRLCFLIYRCPL